MDLKIAAAYIRVSTDDQTEYSPDAQLRELREYAASHGMLLDDRYIYADEGISGRKAERRPAFMEMVRTAKLREHPFDVILVHKFDRFARSREDSVVYKSMLKRCGVEVISIKEPLAEGSYAGVMEAIYESFAEAYSINLGQEVKKGMTERARRGQILTAPPYGYYLGPLQSLPLEEKVAHRPDEVSPHRSSRPLNTFLPHPVEAPYVQEIFRRFSLGEGLFPIAKWLNSEGQHTHRGTPFENRTVEYILRNPVYIGKTRWNPTGKSRRDFDDPNIILSDGTHEPLISMELWDAVQARMADVKARWGYHARPTYELKHWLGGLVRCASCGSTLIFVKPHYFKCNNYVRGRCQCSQHIKVDLLAEAFLDQLRFHASASVATPTVQLLRPKDLDTETKLRRLRQQLERTETKKARLLDAYLNGADILAEYNDMKAALNQEAEDLHRQISDLEANLPQIDPAAALRAAIQLALMTLESPISTKEEKHEAASRILDRCTFDKPTMTLSITYRISI